MKNYQDYILTKGTGRLLSVPVAAAQVQVNLAGTMTLANIFSDDGITPAVNPVNTDSNGHFNFYVADGRYDLVVSGPGLTTFTQLDVEIADVSQDTVSTDVTWNVGNINLLGTTTASLPIVGSITGNAGTSTTATSATNLVGPGTVTGAYTHTGTTTFTGLVQAKNINNVQAVDTINSQGWAGTDVGGWINSAIAALPLYNSKPAGTIYIAQGSYNFTTPIVINSPYVYLVGAPSILTFTVAGTAILFNDAPTSYDGNGGVYNLYLFGNGTAAQIGFDLREVTYQKWQNVSVNSFNGAGSIGILFENVNGATFWTENNDFDNVRGLNNTVGMAWQDNCTAHSGCPSMAYTRFRHVVMSPLSGQTGYLLQHDTSLNGSDLEMQCFPAAGSTCLHLTNASAIQLQRLKIGGDGTGAFNGIVTDVGTFFSTTYMERWNAGTPTDTFNGTYIPYIYVNPGLGQIVGAASGLNIGNTSNTFSTTIDTTLLTTFRTQKTPDVSGTLVVDVGTQGLTNKTLNVPLTNGTALQAFNTTTTCTTGATVGAICTTAAISLPVTEADTSYRVACTGKGLTNVPVVIATTNSSASQFTITIAALTAAAASFASYDCLVVHN